MTPFAIAGVQMHVSAVHENVTAIKNHVDLTMARFPWVQMIVFSELAAFGPLPAKHPKSLKATEAIFCELAVRHGIWLVPGSMYERERGKIYNTAMVIDPTGNIVGKYRKMFPFAPYEANIDSGTEFLVFDVPDVGRFGLSICYDIWFPETTRTLTSMGAEILLVPVLTGTIDRDVEVSMARATAAQFQCYVVDINGLGAGGIGRSCIFDPAGTPIYQAGAGEEIIPVELDLDLVRRQRAVGMHGLGQPLKSFRDRAVDFNVYDEAMFDTNYLNSLGKLQFSERGSRAGLDGRTPQQIEQDIDQPNQENKMPKLMAVGQPGGKDS